MRSNVEDWGESRFGVRLELAPREVGVLIENLRVLQRDAGQHFHLTARDQSAERLGDIEVSVLVDDRSHNMDISSLALPPGAKVRSLGRRGSPHFSYRVLAITLCWIVALWAAGNAAGAQYVDYITTNYVPILIGGIWWSVLALVALHAASLAVTSWKGRVPALLGMLLTIYLLQGLIGRLAHSRF